MRILVPDIASVAGGVERMCLSLFPELTKAGVDVIWVVPQHRTKNLERSLPSGHGVTFEDVDWPLGDWRRYVTALCRRFGDISLVCKLRSKMYLWRVETLRIRWKVDHLLYPWILDEPVPEAREISRFVFVHDRNWAHFPNNFTRTPEKLDSHVENWMSKSRGVVTVSESVALELKAKWPFYSAKIKVIPLAASNKPKFTEELWNSVYGAGKRPPAFYYPATFAPHKGHHILLEAVDLLHERGREFNLTLSGHGTTQIPISSETQSHVRALGYTDGSMVDELYLSADVVILPSLYEGFGLPLAEALSWGARVICSDIPAYREQIERLGAQNEVKVVPPGNAEALADAMFNETTRMQAGWDERYRISKLTSAWTWSEVAANILSFLDLKS